MIKRFKNILYVNETDSHQTSAMTRTVSLAKSNHADLTVVDVIPDEVISAAAGLPLNGPSAKELKAEVTANRLREMATLIGPFKQNIDIQLQVTTGRRFLEVIRMVLSNAFDLVIKPAENPDWMDRLFGSDDMHLLQKCPCPVWLIKPSEKAGYKTVLAAMDIDPAHPMRSPHDLNRTILELAGSIALSDHASLHLAHAWDPSIEQTFLRQKGISTESIDTYVRNKQAIHQKGLSSLEVFLNKWISAYSSETIDPQLHLIQGSPGKIIPRLAEDLSADLVVMGTIARTGISGLIIGNTAEAVFQQLMCSLLAVKPDRFKTPVK